MEQDEAKVVSDGLTKENEVFLSPKRDSLDGEVSTAGQAQKRGPSTPLTPLNQKHSIIRRKMKPIGRRLEFLTFQADNKEEVIDLHCKNWILEQSISRQQEIIMFLELERKVANEDG